MPGLELEVAKVPGPQLEVVGSLPAQVLVLELVVLVLLRVFAHLGAVFLLPAGPDRRPPVIFWPVHVGSLPLFPGPLPFFQTAPVGILLELLAYYLGQFFESRVLTTG